MSNMGYRAFDPSDCPKCGARHASTAGTPPHAIQYCAGDLVRSGDPNPGGIFNTCQALPGEHFHVQCWRCKYTWADPPVAQIQAAGKGGKA